MSRNLSELSGRKGLTDNLFERISELGVETGTPSKEDLANLADEFLVGKANTYGAITFYDFLKPGNKGKKVYVCNGSVCTMAGTQETLTYELKKHVSEDEIGHMCCLGRCHENGSFHYKGHNYSAKSSEEIAAILQDGKTDWKDEYVVESHGEKILTEAFPGVDEYYALLGDVLKQEPQAVLDEMKASGIRGRGGAGFPMGTKWEFCRNNESDVKFVVCNADEGDPGAFSDRYLLEMQPHSVLFGMMVSGYCIGSEWGVLYIRGEYPESVDICQAAIDELRKKGWLGNNIKGSGFNFDLKIVKAQGSYICGEETALLSSIEGQRPEVRIRPPYPAQEGLFNKPTVVNNVETLAAVHWILEHSGKSYAEIGTGKSSGTKLLSLDSFFNKPGLYEVEMGTPLSTIVNDYAGGFRKPVKAMHIGGPLGGIVPTSKMEALSLDFESFSDNGFLLGHASIVCIPEDFSLLAYLEHLMEFAADESCGKCFPCRLGTVRGQEMMHKALHEGYKIDPVLLKDLLDTLEQGSLCAHGGGIPLPVRNAIEHFEEELKPYFV